MKSFKSALAMLLTVLFIMSVGGCGESTVETLDKASVSDIIKASVPCVNAEELYERKKFPIPPEFLTQYGLPSGFDGNNIYVFRNNVPISTLEQNPAVTFRSGLAAYYDIAKGEITTLFEEVSDKFISYRLVGIYDSRIYYLRSESDSDEEACFDTLYRVSLFTKQPEKIAHLQSEADERFSLCFSGIYVYFSDFERSEEKYMMYRYNTQSGQLVEYISDAANPVKYKDGIAYFKDIGENRFQMIYLKPDADWNYLDIIYSADSDKFLYFSGETLFCERTEYAEDETAVNFLVCSSSSGTDKIGEMYEGSDVLNVSGENSILFDINGKPLIYDIENGCFAKPNINREYAAGYSAEHSVMIIGYDEAFINAVVYVYLPREPYKEETK